MPTHSLIPQPECFAASFLVLALACVSLSVAAADRNYTVKRNDTLTDIAHKSGLTDGELAGHNGLKKTDKLRIGQKLVVPDSATAREDSAADSRLPNGLGKIRVEPGKWKYIVIHHSAAPNASVKGMDYYHRVDRHMENGLTDDHVSTITNRSHLPLRNSSTIRLQFVRIH